MIECEYTNCGRRATKTLYFRVWDIKKKPLPDTLVQPYRHICNHHWTEVEKAISRVGEITQ
jgi:hypothetical protein